MRGQVRFGFALAFMLASAVAVAGGINVSGGGLAGPAGPAFSGGTLTSQLLVADTGSACSSTLPWAVAGDTNTGMTRLAADQLAMCIGGAKGLSLDTTYVRIPTANKYGFEGQDYYWAGYAASGISFPGSPAYQINGGVGSGNTPYVEARGHLVVTGEIHATDYLAVYGANGGLAKFYDDFATPTQVAEIDDGGQMFAGSGSSAADIGLGFLADRDGTPTGWWRPSADKWRFVVQGSSAWDLTSDLMPQQDGGQNLGDATHRLNDIHTQGLTSEAGLSIVSSDGTTQVAEFTSGGAIRLGTDGTTAVPAIGWIASEGGGNGLGFKRTDTNEFEVVQNHNTSYWKFGGGGIYPITDNYLDFGQSGKRIGNSYAYTVDLRHLVAGAGSVSNAGTGTCTAVTVAGKDTAFRAEGTCTAGQTIKVSFASGYTNAPVCVGTADNAQAAAVTTGAFEITTSTSQVTITFNTAGTGSRVNVHCIGI